MKNKLENVKQSISIGLLLGFVGYFLLPLLFAFTEDLKFLDYTFFSIATALGIISLRKKSIKFNIGNKKYLIYLTFLIDGFLTLFTASYLIGRGILLSRLGFNSNGFYSSVFGYVDVQKLAYLVLAYVAFMTLKTKYESKNPFRKTLKSYTLDLIAWLFYLALIL